MVERYAETWTAAKDEFSLEPDHAGMWVRAADYDALAAKLAEVERERDEFQAKAISLVWYVPDDVTCGQLRKDADNALVWLVQRRMARTADGDSLPLDR
jgi:hypothetical protein